MKILKKISRWFAVADYAELKEANTRKVVKRYARGNTNVQAGAYLTKPEIDKMHAKAKQALQLLNKEQERSRNVA